MSSENNVSSSALAMVRATVIQAATVFHDTPATLDKTEMLIAEVAELGSQLVVFPEAFIGGQPQGTNFAEWLTKGGQEKFLKYHASAVDIPGPEMDRLAGVAGKYGVYLVMGAIERNGKISFVICWWENMMPLLRTAMYAKADTSVNWQFCRRGGCPPPPEYPFSDDPTLLPDSNVAGGGSVIVSPPGTAQAGRNFEGEGLITANLDLEEIVRAKCGFDVVGHYSRPDVLSLIVKDGNASSRMTNYAVFLGS